MRSPLGEREGEVTTQKPKQELSKRVSKEN